MPRPTAGPQPPPCQWPPPPCQPPPPCHPPPLWGRQICCASAGALVETATPAPRASAATAAKAVLFKFPLITSSSSLCRCRSVRRGQLLRWAFGVRQECSIGNPAGLSLKDGGAAPFPPAR